MTRLGHFCTLGNHSKPVATVILPKSPTLFGSFCKDVKINHFSYEIIFGQFVKSFLGNFYRHVAIFIWSHSRGLNLRPWSM